MAFPCACFALSCSVYDKNKQIYKQTKLVALFQPIKSQTQFDWRLLRVISSSFDCFVGLLESVVIG